jgi:hypothetical protein
MGFWFWFWIFLAIAVLAMVVYVLIALSLFDRAKKIAGPIAKLNDLTAKLNAAAAQRDEEHPPVGALETPELVIIARRNELKRSSRERKEARTRRLVKRIKDLDFDESRLL